jgi:hypothetical protein
MAREVDGLMQTCRIDWLDDNAVSSVRASWGKSIDIGKAASLKQSTNIGTTDGGDESCIKLILSFSH